MIAPIPRTANMKNVFDNPKASSKIGNEKPTKKLVIHKQKTVTPIPKPLNFKGKISDNINQVTGEIAPCWKAKNVTVSDKTTYGSAADPSSTYENIPINVSAEVVPIKPMVNMGRRPILPNNQIPTKVAATEMTPFAMLPTMAACVPKPAFFKIWVP